VEIRTIVWENIIWDLFVCFASWQNLVSFELLYKIYFMLFMNFAWKGFCSDLHTYYNNVNLQHIVSASRLEMIQKNWKKIKYSKNFVNLTVPQNFPNFTISSCKQRQGNDEHTKKMYKLCDFRSYIKFHASINILVRDLKVMCVW
jgi:hypothetical protein